MEEIMKAIRKEIGNTSFWMANAAIMGACKSINNGKKEPRLNNQELHLASKVLFALFHTCEMNIIDALINTAKCLDGIKGNHSNYFLTFIAELNKIETVNIREPNWVIES